MLAYRLLPWALALGVITTVGVARWRNAQPPPRPEPVELIGSLRAPVSSPEGLAVRIDELEQRLRRNADDTDLVSVFLTGLPGVNQPPGVRPAEMLRLNTDVAPNPNPQRLGALAGDPAGFPNGRRLTDDVIGCEASRAP